MIDIGAMGIDSGSRIDHLVDFGGVDLMIDIGAMSIDARSGIDQIHHGLTGRIQNVMSLVTHFQDNVFIVFLGVSGWSRGSFVTHNDTVSLGFDD
eukprot:CAMPEP_0172440178 /NCGR_PEP_ID=MMETSP1065-20121228/905_1 /TAXON_ID=265537 /ORGANISM="Amphiprora paludosa, Strain CCMP125" /LENGTH=94 /DNA_ID=CAMNT_0013188961 /DNA_START=225 /DNA_END=509 /DNA_ORIENTATION=+